MNNEVDSILANLAIWVACLIALSTFARPMLRTYNGSSVEDLEQLTAQFLGTGSLRIIGPAEAPEKHPWLDRGQKRNFILVIFGSEDSARKYQTVYSGIAVLIREDGISYIMAFDE